LYKNSPRISHSILQVKKNFFFIPENFRKLFFSSFESYKKIFCDKNNPTGFQVFLAGALTGFSTTSLIFPLDVAKVEKKKNVVFEINKKNFLCQKKN
jgi:hypothetical protein